MIAKCSLDTGVVTLMQYLGNWGSAAPFEGKNVSCGLFTENVQEGPSSDGGDAAAAERRLALVVAAVSDRRQADDQPAAKIPDPRADHRPVLPPSDAHFDERSGGEGEKLRRRQKKEKKRAIDRECGF